MPTIDDRGGPRCRTRHAHGRADGGDAEAAAAGGGRPIIEHVLGGLARGGCAARRRRHRLSRRADRSRPRRRRARSACDSRTAGRSTPTARRARCCSPQPLSAAQPFVRQLGRHPGAARRSTREFLDAFARRPCDALLAVNAVDDPWRGAAVYVDADWRVQRLEEKPPRGTSTTALEQRRHPGVHAAGARLRAPPRRRRRAASTSCRRRSRRWCATAASCAPCRCAVRGRDVGTPDDLAAAQRSVRDEPGAHDVTRRLRRGARRCPGRSASARASAAGRRWSCARPGASTSSASTPTTTACRCCRWRSTATCWSPPPRATIAACGWPTSTARFAPRSYAAAGRHPPLRRRRLGQLPQGRGARAVRRRSAPDALRGGDFLVDGNMPPGAGLSSSSALVVASALALLAVNDREHAAAAARRADGGGGALRRHAERRHGSGGVPARRRPGTRCASTSIPLRARAGAAPAGYAFVVCHSLVEAEKSGAARDAYNSRVVECRLACRVLERAARRQPAAAAGAPRRAARALSRPLAGRLRRDSGERAAAAAAALDEIADSSARAASARRGAVGAACTPHATYAIVRRARHVLTEAERVDAGRGGAGGGRLARRSSALMDASHASCRDDYEISCPALEELVAAAKAAGAIGARLTGAGFGGCTVNLVPAADASAVPRPRSSAPSIAATSAARGSASTASSSRRAPARR